MSEAPERCTATKEIEGTSRMVKMWGAYHNCERDEGHEGAHRCAKLGCIWE